MATVTRIDASDRQARREFDRLLGEALAEILAARSGDVGGIWGAHRAVNSALDLVLTYRWDAA